MATKKRKTSSSNSRRKSSTGTRKTVSKQQVARDIEMFREIKLVILFVVFVALFLCNFGILGLVGKALSNVMFGIFGLTAYIAPVLIYLGILFWHANIGNATAVRKILSGAVLFLMVGVVCDIILFVTNKDKSVKDKRYMVVLMICSAVAVLCMLDGIID